MIELIHEDEHGRLYRGDGLEALSEACPSYPLILTDPKYNVGKDFGPDVDDLMAPDKYEEWSRRWLTLAITQAATVAFTPGIANLAMWYRILAPVWEMCWLKPNARQRGEYGANRWEPLLVYGSRLMGRVRDDAFAAQIDYEDGRALWHPTPKPFELPLQVYLRLLVEPDQYVFDPFFGTGTNIIVARWLGVPYVGCEINPDYCARVVAWLSSPECEERGARMRARFQVLYS